MLILVLELFFSNICHITTATAFSLVHSIKPSRSILTPFLESLPSPLVLALFEEIHILSNCFEPQAQVIIDSNI